jgi:GH18 family chitinase
MVFSFPATSLAVTVAGYLPHYRLGGNYSNTQKFRDQMSLLDEVVYFGEYQFDSLGNVTFGGTNIATANNATTELLSTTVSRIRAANPNAKITFAMGGAGNSGTFAPVAADPILRDAASTSINSVISRYGLDGVDLDWEGNSIPSNDATIATNFGLLTQDINNNLASGKSISATIQYNRFLAALAVADHVDLLRIMSYDAPERDSSVPSGSGNHTSVVGATSMIQEMIDQGIDPALLGVGVAFYGLELGTYGGAEPFVSIAARYAAANGGAEIPDDLSEWDGLGFDSPDTIREKGELAVDLDLQQVFTWELAQDTEDYRLTTAMANSIPEPSTLLLFSLGALGLLSNRRK